MNDQTLYKIGEVSKLKLVSIQTIRLYERLGLFTPAYVDVETGYRYYSIEQFILLDRIRFFKNIGFSLKEIKYLNNLKDVDDVVKEIKLKQKEFSQKIRVLHSVNEKYNALTREIEQIQLQIQENPDFIQSKFIQPFYGVSDTSQYSKDLYGLENMIFNVAKKQPYYEETSMNCALVRKYEGDYVHAFNFYNTKELIMPIDVDFIEPKDVNKYSIGNALVTYHKGSKDSLPYTLKRLDRYMKDNNFKGTKQLYIKAIINRFISYDIEDEIREIIVPYI